MIFIWYFYACFNALLDLYVYRLYMYIFLIPLTKSLNKFFSFLLTKGILIYFFKRAGQQILQSDWFLMWSRNFLSLTMVMETCVRCVWLRPTIIIIKVT